MIDEKNSAINEVLCCCEYINVEGQRSHLLAVCCECELLDESFERCITCKRVSPSVCCKIVAIGMDRIRIPWCDGKGARPINPEVALAAFLMPCTVLIASQGWECMIVTYLLLPILLYLIHNKWLKNHSVRPRFFLSWSVTSLVFLMSVFEFEVVPYLEILFHENFILVCFVAVAFVCAVIVRKDPGRATESSSMFGKTSSNNGKEGGNGRDVTLTLQEGVGSRCQFCNISQTSARVNHCHKCGMCVLRRDHHSLWLDTCIGAKNHRCFILGLGALLAACIYGGGLAFTTICHPVKVFNLFLVPDSCTEVFGDFHIGLCFASAVYTAILGICVILTLLQQFWLICRNTTMQEFKRGRMGVHDRGIILNCKDFWFTCH